MMKKHLVSCVILAVGSLLLLGQSDAQVSKSPLQKFPGFVPDSETAVKIIEIVSSKFLGTRSLQDYKFSAILVKDEWKVTGIRRIAPAAVSNPGQDPAFESVPIFYINRSNAKIRFILK
jgi:hypothetical protein